MAEQVELEIRPTMRFVKAGYAGVGLLFGAALVWWIVQQDTLSLAAVGAAALLFLWPMAHHLDRQRTRCRVSGGHLRFEHGIFSTTVKTIQVANIQDVTVRRSVAQRMWGVGDLRIETAGPSSNLEIPDVDDPQETAEKILASVPRR